MFRFAAGFLVLFALNGAEYMAVFFAISGTNSRRVYQDVIRFGDSAGKSVLAPRSDAILTIQAGATGGAPAYRVMPLSGGSASMAQRNANENRSAQPEIRRGQ